MAAGSLQDGFDSERGPLVGVRTLITGAGGFVGGWVASEFCRLGAEVHCTLRPGAPAGDLPGGCKPHPIDLTAAEAVSAFVAQLRPQLVINLACHGVGPEQRDPTNSESLNATLPKVLANILQTFDGDGWGGLRLLHVGSAAEYGLATGNLEEDTTPRPQTLYGVTKWKGTQAISAAASRGLSALTARPFNIYGPRQHPSKLLPTLIRAAANEGVIPLTTGEQRRDFIYVGDVAAGLARLACVSEGSPKPVNLATGVLTPVRSFVEVAARQLAIPPARLGFGMTQVSVSEMAHGPTSLTRLLALTGWQAPTTISAGIHNTIAYGAGAA